ncbi:MAG: DUF3108 domain-containing protein [Alphaproteobacteria bacterium]
MRQLANKFRRIAALSLAGAAFSTLSMASDVAETPAGRALQGNMTIDLYFGGFNVGALNLATTLDGTSYAMKSEMGTRGLLSAFVDGFARLEANGEIRDGGLKPVYYRAASGTGDEVKRDSQVHFTEGSPAKVVAVPAYKDDDRPPVPLEEQVGTVDPLSAALFSATFADGENVCAGTIKIFDGRRRYNLHLSYVGEEVLTTRHQERYSGPAARCEVVFEQLKGFQPDGAGPRKRKSYDPATVWIARFGAPDGGADVLMPVKVVADTSWGAAVAHGSNIKIKQLAATQQTANIDHK